MCMYLFNIFNESKDSNHITTTLACLDINSLLFITNVGFSKLEKPYIPSNSHLYLPKYLLKLHFHNQKRSKFLP